MNKAYLESGAELWINVFMWYMCLYISAHCKSKVRVKLLSIVTWLWWWREYSHRKRASAQPQYVCQASVIMSPTTTQRHHAAPLIDSPVSQKPPPPFSPPPSAVHLPLLSVTPRCATAAVSQIIPPRLSHRRRQSFKYLIGTEGAAEWL